jgi:hypothetical protein
MSAPITPGPSPFSTSDGPTFLPPSGPIVPVFGFTPGHGRLHIGIPLPIPHGEVQGYTMLHESTEDDAVARAAAKFQAFYDALAPDEQEIIELLVQRAAGPDA